MSIQLSASQDTILVQMIPIISAMLLKFIRQIWDVYGEEGRVSDKNST